MKNDMKYYDVIIIGAGPAGIFTAQYILKNTKQAKVLLVDKGNYAEQRKCIGDCSICDRKDSCNVLCGVGGSGLFSDGKLVLDLHAGGRLDAISNLTEDEKKKLTRYIVETLKGYDGVSKMGPSISTAEDEKWQKLLKKEGLTIRHYDVLHMGTNNLQHITMNFIEDLKKNSRFTLKTNSEIVKVDDAPNGESILCEKNGEKFITSNAVFAIGKTGSDWLKQIFTKNSIHFLKTKTYVGIRLETSHDLIQKLFQYSFDPKIWAFYGNQKVKTHCFCRHGEVICSNYMGYPVIGGHTRYTENNIVQKENISPKSNFNVLVSTDVSKEEILKVLEKMKELNPDGGLVQRLSDFLYAKNERKNKTLKREDRYVYGDVRGLLDEIDNIGEKISDFIMRLGKIVPGVTCEKNLVYAPALEWFMDSVEVDEHMETAHKSWFAVGDGAGLSQGIVHAAATGIIAAHEICLRMEE